MSVLYTKYEKKGSEKPYWMFGIEKEFTLKKLYYWFRVNKNFLNYFFEFNFAVPSCHEGRGPRINLRFGWFIIKRNYFDIAFM